MKGKAQYWTLVILAGLVAVGAAGCAVRTGYVVPTAAVVYSPAPAYYRGHWIHYRGAPYYVRDSGWVVGSSPFYGHYPSYSYIYGYGWPTHMRRTVTPHRSHHRSYSGYSRHYHSRY